MAERERGALQWLFGALLGGLLASGIATGVFTLVLSGGSDPAPGAPLAAALVGVACTTLLMAGGLLVGSRAEWLAPALLFGSGFTGLWSFALSFPAGHGWTIVSAWTLAAATGLVLGRRRFGARRVPKEVAREDLAAT
jgi:hypothetical protein